MDGRFVKLVQRPTVVTRGPTEPVVFTLPVPRPALQAGLASPKVFHLPFLPLVCVCVRGEVVLGRQSPRCPGGWCGPCAGALPKKRALRAPERFQYRAIKPETFAVRVFQGIWIMRVKTRIEPCGSFGLVDSGVVDVGSGPTGCRGMVLRMPMGLTGVLCYLQKGDIQV